MLTAGNAEHRFDRVVGELMFFKVLHIAISRDDQKVRTYSSPPEVSCLCELSLTRKRTELVKGTEQLLKRVDDRHRAVDLSSIRQ